MEDPFYLNTSKKLRKGSHATYSNKTFEKKDDSSIYSLHDDESDCFQYPGSTLSPSQKVFIETFLKAITSDDSVTVDLHTRGIHTVGCWKSLDFKATVVLTMIQPHITTSTANLYGMSIDVAKRYSREYASKDICLEPTIVKTTRYCQAMGRHAMQFADELIRSQQLRTSQVSWSIIVLSLSQPVFHVIVESLAYECKLSHVSCKIMAECIPSTATASFPTTGSQNFAFRSSMLRAGMGTGPAITIHSAGTIQYQGKPESISIVAKAFKDCINQVMDSKHSTKFLRSLVVLRSVSF